MDKREITSIATKYDNDPRIAEKGAYSSRPRSREMTYRSNGNVNDVSRDVKLVKVIKKEDMGLHDIEYSRDVNLSTFYGDRASQQNQSITGSMPDNHAYEYSQTDNFHPQTEDERKSQSYNKYKLDQSRGEANTTTSNGNVAQINQNT